MVEEKTPRRKGLLSLNGSLIVLLLLVIIFIEIIYFIPEKEEAKPQGYEVAALANLRHISKAQTEFKGESTAYGELAALGKAGLINELLAVASDMDNALSGYVFNLKANADHWSCVAVPVIPGTTGTKSFYTDQTGAIRCSIFTKTDDTPAGPDSPTLEEWCCGTVTAD